MKHEEHFWARRAVEGDSNAFGLLAARYLPSVQKWIGMRVSADKVDDLSQETLLRAFESIENLRNPQRFPQWLRGISLNVVRMHYRAESRNHTPGGEAHFSPNGSSSKDSRRHSTEERFIESIRSEQLADALLGVKAAHGEVLALHYLDGMSYAQISKALGISVAAVKSRMHRGRQRVKERLLQMETPMTKKSDRMTSARIHEVFRASLVGKDPLAIVILKPDDQEVYVPIWVPEDEGTAILMSVRGETAPRPLTHDLMADLLRTAGVAVERVAVTDLENDVFYGEVRVRGRNGAVDIDARPSDAIALALLMEAELFINQQVIDSVGVEDLSPDSLRKNPKVEIAPLELPDFDEWARKPGSDD